MFQEGLVSVIMSTYNDSTFLAGSVRSILAQTYTNLELLITDDCSTNPETRKILEQLAKEDSRVNIEYLEKNQGPGYARNNSIKRARGQYIAFCDSDDRWMPEKLCTQISAMNEGKYALCCSSYIICDTEDKHIGINISPKVITYGMMTRDNKVGCLTAIYDIKLLGKKYYMPTIRKRQDWALFIKITQDCKKALGITTPLAYYRKHANSVSSNKFSLVRYNIAVYRDCMGFSKLKSYLYFFFLFLPTYTTKILTQKYHSWKYIKKDSCNQ